MSADVRADLDGAGARHHPASHGLCGLGLWRLGLGHPNQQPGTPAAAATVLDGTPMARMEKAGEALGRATVARALGIFLATVGGAPITGEVRYTFGQYQPIAGFNLLAVVIGILAFFDILIRIADGADSGGARVDFEGLVPPRLRDWKGRGGTLLRGIGIGNVVGILPGTGSATAAFIAYAEAKRSSPRSSPASSSSTCCCRSA